MSSAIKALKEQQQETNEPLFFAVSLRKLLIMTIFTSTWFMGGFSLYEIYWLFAHIRHLKQHNSFVNVTSVPYFMIWMMCYLVALIASSIFFVIVFNSFILYLIALFSICTLRLLAIYQWQKQANQLVLKNNPLAKLDDSFSSANMLAIFFCVGLTFCLQIALVLFERAIVDLH